MDVFSRNIIIAIDGPAGSGKSSAARLLAQKLGCLYLDTGALYRAVGWKAMQDGMDLQDAAALKTLCAGLDLSVRPDGNGMKVFVDGRDVSGEIRTPEVSRAAAAVAAVPVVRQRLLRIQREVGEKAGGQGGVVVEGRDIGTVVFPDAPVKFFLEASPEVRVERRHAELRQQGLAADLSATRREIDTRDLKDANREIAPLKPAGDAIRIDSTALTLDGVVSEMMAVIERKRSGNAD
ncbi:MAG: (d)CMP kinase [Nitrospirae bacterium]|nr:(d)CMP kinase [Nitrospirota bacterium]